MWSVWEKDRRDKSEWDYKSMGEWEEEKDRNGRWGNGEKMGEKINNGNVRRWGKY